MYLIKLRWILEMTPPYQHSSFLYLNYASKQINDISNTGAYITWSYYLFYLSLSPTRLTAPHSTHLVLIIGVAAEVSKAVDEYWFVFSGGVHKRGVTSGLKRKKVHS